MRVLIQYSQLATPVDVTRHVLDGSLSIEDSVNVPTLISFQLSPVDNTFVVPTRSDYVTVVSDIYASGIGYGSGKILATGFVTTEPERTFMGLTQERGPFKYAQYTYNIQATSDEWILNCNAVPYIPAFVNQTDSQILTSIANALMPGFFDVTSLVATGTLVPYFQYDPSQTWSDIAKTFADANRFHYKVINKKILYQPFGDQGLGIAYDEQKQRDKQLSPFDLKTGVLTVPPVNDCTVLGAVEPQANWDNYYVGDGFSSNFQMRHQVFQGTTATLLQDDWTEGSFTQGTWIENDPLGVINLADNNGNAIGALNIVQKGNTGVYTPQQSATYIQAQNGVELGGGLNLQHGQITFNDTAVGGGGIIGGIYGTSIFTPGNCLAGFGITGQPNIGTFTVVSVQITQTNSPLVALTINGVAPTNLYPGNVFSCAGFGGASFLNGTSQTVVGVTQISSTQYVIISQGTAIYNALYGPTADSGAITFAANAVFVTASGAAGIVIQPIFNGQYVGQPVVTQVNHQYLLQTWLGAQTKTRYTRPYTNLTRTSTYGNQDLAASGTITFVVTDVNLGQYVIEQQNPLFGLFPAAPPPVLTKYSQVGVNLPPFALYCLINGIDLNVSINYTLLSLPPQGYLTVQSLTGASGGSLPWLPSELSPPIHYMLGFGQDNQTAQISQQGEAFALSFYTDDIPSVGARIRFQSWAAGQSVARVQDTVAIAQEAKISGDSGIRAAIMTNLSPLPRTSDECEAAAGAAILDREYPQFQGTYSVQTVPYKYESLYAPSIYQYPTTGRYLYINAPSRGITGQNFYVNTVRIQVTELRQEVMTISIDYGPDLYLEKLLPAFLERDQNILTPTQTVAPPNPITLPEVLNAYLPTLDNAQVVAIVDSLTGNFITIDLGALPVTGCEVRNVDSGWGVANQGRIGYFTTRVFTMPRSVRDQTWYLRQINGPFFSRFSKALRVVYPLIPSAPALVSFNPTDIVLDYAGDVRDIYGLELRAVAASGTFGSFFIEIPDSNPEQNIFIATRQKMPLPAPNTALTDFSSTVYSFSSSPLSPNPKFQVGDIISINVYADSSFNGFRIVTASGSIATSNFTPPVTFSHTSSINSCQTIESNLLPYVDTVGQSGLFPVGQLAAVPPGTAQLVSRGAYVPAASGSFSNNIATIVTQTPHGLTVNQLVVIGAALALNTFGAGYNPYPVGFTYAPANGSIYCGTWQVQSVINSTTFTVIIANNFLPNGGVVGATAFSLPSLPLNGLVAGIPTSIAFPAFVPNAAPGTLLQKPIFSPSDLVIDLTQSNIQDVLSLLQSANGSTRLAGLAAYFFNLQWDYSQPTLIPSFAVPSITGLTVVPSYQGLTWGLSSGNPDGHRVETSDLVTGVLYSKYTINNPSNPQILLQANLPISDYMNPRLIKVTPFDALGDGIPSYVVWYGISGGYIVTAVPGASGSIVLVTSSGGLNPGSYTIGSTYNGVIPSSTAMVRIPLDQMVQFFGGFLPSQAYLETAPTGTFTFTIIRRPVGTLNDITVGTITFLGGNNRGQYTSTFLGPLVCNIGDLIKVVSQGTTDLTAANFGMTLSGSKYFGA